MAHENPSSHQCRLQAEAQHSIMVASAFIAKPNDEDFLRQLAVKVKQATRATRGNRPDSAIVTWDDLRLRTIATFKVCLGVLERPGQADSIPVDTTNRCYVGRQGEFITVHRGPSPAARMTKTEALRFAGWLVAVADDGDGEWERTLDAIKNT